jgi:hypothetical protein
MDALRMRVDAYGENNPRVADMYFNIAGTHAAMQNFTEAEDLLRR